MALQPICFLVSNDFRLICDFDLLEDGEADFVFQKAIEIVQKYGSLKNCPRNDSVCFVWSRMRIEHRNIKVEINRRKFESSYEIKTYLGVSMQVMQIEDMFAHKLMAMHERIGDTSRDIFDVWFFLQKRYLINKSMVEKRAEMSFNQFISTCIDQLQKLDNRRILYGLGELLLPNQKDWAKAKLRQETIALLTLRLKRS